MLNILLVMNWTFCVCIAARVYRHKSSEQPRWTHVSSCICQHAAGTPLMHCFLAVVCIQKLSWFLLKFSNYNNCRLNCVNCLCMWCVTYRDVKYFENVVVSLTKKLTIFLVFVVNFYKKNKCYKLAKNYFISRLKALRMLRKYRHL